ncbi:MAG: hypothetical protein HKN43_02700 [Rhodothermales bacterium]|nr:hypothetical protein [Rhodothermales bacterium]
MKSKVFLGSALALAFVVILAGCQNSETDDQSDDSDSSESTQMTMSGPDTTGAAVWAYIQDADYQNTWTSWPGKGSLYTGQQPHGALLTTYLNDVAAEALASKSGSMPDGAIIVKENYMPDENLAAVTVMHKVQDYNPAEGNWFYSKHLPDGALDQMPNGMGMQGKVPGCIGCHRAQSANDFIFTSSLSE